MTSIKSIVLRLMQFLGIFRFFRWWNRNNVIILAVHGVADHDSDSLWNPLRDHLSPGTFAEQVDLISQRYTWVPLDVAVEMIEGKCPLQPNAVAITFDDGYENNKSIALPILEKYDIIPTFYVPTGFIDNRRTFWFDRFDFAIQKIRDPYRIDLKSEVFEFSPGDRAQQVAEYERLRSHSKAAFDSEGEFIDFFDSQCKLLEGIVESSLSSVQATDIWSAILSTQDIQNLSTSRTATIGSHTVDHIRLDKVNSQECLRQLMQSKNHLEEITQHPCDQFCYPNGSVNSNIVNSVIEGGYHSAVGTIPGFNPVGADRYQLKRIHLPDHSDSARLGALLSGFDFAVEKLRTALRK